MKREAAKARITRDVLKETVFVMVMAALPVIAMFALMAALLPPDWPE